MHLLSRPIIEIAIKENIGASKIPFESVADALLSINIIHLTKGVIKVSCPLKI
jgi:hypothetical protein